MTNLRDYGYKETGSAGEGSTCPQESIPARIIDIRRDLFTAVCAYGEVSAVMSGALRFEMDSLFPAVGDFVLLRYNERGASAITQILPRHSKFSRTDFSGHAAGYVKTIREQVVAANFDYVFMLSSLNRDFNVRRIARYITAARLSGGIPVVILTKADLCEDYDAPLRAVKETAEDIDVIAVSTVNGTGLSQLQRYLRPAVTVVLLGMSGVGKSTLINALAGCTLAAVNEIREKDARGRHTTTHRQLFMLPSGALVMDTPGMRELGLWDASDGLSAMFADIEALFTQCRFSDCRHGQEPGCAIREALACGALSSARWENYLAQKQEASFVKSKAIPVKQVKKNKGTPKNRSAATNIHKTRKDWDV